MKNILDTFFKWLDFRGVSAVNREHEEHEKLKYKFKDEALNKEWVGFYSVYLNGFNAGRDHEAQALGVYSAQRISKIPTK